MHSMSTYQPTVVERSPVAPAVGALNPRFSVLITRTHRITMSTNKQETEARATIARSRAPQKGSVTPLPRVSPQCDTPNRLLNSRYRVFKGPFKGPEGHCPLDHKRHASSHV